MQILARQLVINCCLLQVADADEGPKTKRSYNFAKIPDGNALAGAVVDWQGHVMGADSILPQTSDWPLISPQMDIAQQEDVHESLYTGVKVIQHARLCDADGCSLQDCHNLQLASASALHAAVLACSFLQLEI